jgi:hypothetical protein
MITCPGIALLEKEKETKKLYVYVRNELAKCKKEEFSDLIKAIRAPEPRQLGVSVYFSAAFGDLAQGCSKSTLNIAIGL